MSRATRSRSADGQPVQWLRPTSTWQAGEQIVDRYGLLLPDLLPAGQYTIAVGLYHPATGQRLPVSAGPASFAIELGPISSSSRTICLEYQYEQNGTKVKFAADDRRPLGYAALRCNWLACCGDGDAHADGCGGAAEPTAAPATTAAPTPTAVPPNIPTGRGTAARRDVPPTADACRRPAGPPSRVRRWSKKGDCAVEYDLDLAGYPDLLAKMGCALAEASNDAVAINEFGEGPDYNRFMLWFSSELQIYVLFPDQTWQAYLDTWSEGQAELSCNPLNVPPTSPPAAAARLWQAVVQRGRADRQAGHDRPRGAPVPAHGRTTF